MSTKTAGRRSGAENVFEQIHDVMFLFRMKVMQASRETSAGVAGMEFRALHFFERHPGATQQDLVRHSGRDKGQIARITKTLTARGLLCRDPATPRASGLRLTDLGARLHQQFQLHRNRLAKECASVLTALEQAQLHELLQKLKESLAHLP